LQRGNRKSGEVSVCLNLQLDEFWCHLGIVLFCPLRM
jgi:hypothetical protein